MDEPDAAGVAAQLYPALERGDRELLDRLLAADFVGDTTRGLPLGLGGTYLGPAQMRREFWGAIGRAYDVVARPAQIDVLADGRVMVRGTYHGLARSTGRAFTADFVHLLRVVDGQITELTQLTDSGAWADALEPVAPPHSDGDLESGFIEFRVDEGVARVVLARPEASNALDVAMARDLRRIATTIDSDPAIRAVLISAVGDRFSVGGDIDVFAASPHAELPELLNGMINDYHAALEILHRTGKPIVAAVQGAVAGGGLGLIFVADLVVAAEGTKFALAFGALGLTSDGGASYFLPRVVGKRLAARMYYENLVLDAETALDRDLVSEIVPIDDLSTRSEELARTLAKGPRIAFAAMRRMLRTADETTPTLRFQEERHVLTSVARSRDADEGIAAYVSRRRPDFSGS